VKKSKHFYQTVLGQHVDMDFEKNVRFKGGLALWEREYALNLIFQEKLLNIQV